MNIYPKKIGVKYIAVQTSEDVQNNLDNSLEYFIIINVGECNLG